MSLLIRYQQMAAITGKLYASTNVILSIYIFTIILYMSIYRFTFYLQLSCFSFTFVPLKSTNTFTIWARDHYNYNS